MLKYHDFNCSQTSLYTAIESKSEELAQYYIFRANSNGSGYIIASWIVGPLSYGDLCIAVSDGRSAVHWCQRHKLLPTS